MKENEDWILNFREPSDRIFDQVKELIITSRIVNADNDNSSFPRDDSEASLKSSLDVIYPLVVDAVKKDYQENLIEEKTSPWTFDYVVIQPIKNLGYIDIMTRLFDREKSSDGNVFYGISIKKIGDDDYLYWKE